MCVYRYLNVCILSYAWSTIFVLHHNLCSLRPNWIKNFVDFKCLYVMFVSFTLWQYRVSCLATFTHRNTWLGSGKYLVFWSVASNTDGKPPNVPLNTWYDFTLTHGEMMSQAVVSHSAVTPSTSVPSPDMSHFKYMLSESNTSRTGEIFVWYVWNVQIQRICVMHKHCVLILCAQAVHCSEDTHCIESSINAEILKNPKHLESGVWWRYELSRRHFYLHVIKKLSHARCYRAH